MYLNACICMGLSCLCIMVSITEKDFNGKLIKVEIATRRMNNSFGGGRGGRGGGRGGKVILMSDE